jgi:hypothetical protein
MELCKDARRVESYFGDEFVKRVSAESEERGEACDGGRVRRARSAAHDDGEDVYFGTWPMAADGICEGCVFGANQVGCLRGVVVRVVLPFPYLNLFN